MTEKVQADMRKLWVICETVPATQIYLFGSYAYGQPHKDSDYDICVVLTDDRPRPLEAAVAVRRALRGRIKMPMDILATAETSFNDRLGVPTLGVFVFSRASRYLLLPQFFQTAR